MPQFKRTPIATAIAILFSTPGAVSAQTAPAPEQTLPQVNVIGAQDHFRTDSNLSSMGTETPLRDVPQFINTVPQSLIRSQGATSLGDALRNVPGITYAAAEGGTQANLVYYMRGFPVNQDIFIDGLRDMGEYNRDLFATEAVEVLKGPSALMFGRGSTGGLINQISKIADLLPRKEVAVTVGSFEQKRVTADLNLNTGGDSAFRLVALAEDSGSYRYPQDVERVGLAPSVRWGIGTRTELMLSYYYLKTKDVTDYGQPTLTPAFTGNGFFAMPPVAANKYYGFANYDYANHETNIATFRIDHRFNNDVSLRNTLRVSRFERQMEATIATLRTTDANGAAVTPATPLSLLMVTRNHDTGRTRDNDDDAIINQTDVTWKLSAWGMKHVVLTGMELSRERLNRWNYAMDADPLTAGNQAPSAATPLLSPDPYSTLSYTKTPNLRGKSQGDTLAFYAQDQLEMTREWKAVLGVRWERFDAEARTSNYITDATTAGPFQRTDYMTSGRAGLIWQPSERQSYYVSASNSFSPSGELGVYSGTAQTNLSALTQSLDPEENLNAEVGAQWEVGRGVQLRSALFRTEKINQRINDSTTGTTILAGKRRVDGLEMQLTGAITPNWDVYSGVAFMHGEIVKSSVNQGKTPLGVPDFVGNVWTIYRLGGGWEVGGGVNGNNGFWLTDANNGAVPGYAVVDATVAYVQRKYELRFNLFNVGDKVYYVGGYQNSPNRVLPGIPRAASLTARFNFD